MFPKKKLITYINQKNYEKTFITHIKVGLRDKTDKLNNVNRDLDILKSAYNSKLEIFNAVKEKDK